MADEMSNQDGSREADEALEQLFDVEDMEGAQESGDEEVGLTSPDSTTDSTVVTKADNITNPNIHYGSEVAELKAVGGPSGPFDLPIEESAVDVESSGSASQAASQVTNGGSGGVQSADSILIEEAVFAPTEGEGSSFTSQAASQVTSGGSDEVQSADQTFVEEALLAAATVDGTESAGTTSETEEAEASGEAEEIEGDQEIDEDVAQAEISRDLLAEDVARTEISQEIGANSAPDDSYWGPAAEAFSAELEKIAFPEDDPRVSVYERPAEAVDTIAVEPSLELSSASGSEDTAISLSISTALGDLDGSESHWRSRH